MGKFEDKVVCMNNWYSVRQRAEEQRCPLTGTAWRSGVKMCRCLLVVAVSTHECMII